MPGDRIPAAPMAAAGRLEVVADRTQSRWEWRGWRASRSGHDRPVAFLLQSRCWAGALTRKQPFAWRCKFARAGGGFVEARPLEYRSATSVPSQDETVEPAVEISLTRAH